jgi:hypothetical protein
MKNIHILPDWYVKIKPNKFVIHTSHKKYRNAIFRNGLLVRIGFSYSGNWTEDEFGEIKPAVFAMDTDCLEKAYQSEYNDPDYDYWLIDTSDMIWYEDANIGYPCIMTFENINISKVNLMVNKPIKEEQL